MTGFDGFEPEFAGNKIATVFQNFYEIGRSSIDLALEHYKYGITELNRKQMLKTAFIAGNTL